MRRRNLLLGATLLPLSGCAWMRGLFSDEVVAVPPTPLTKLAGARTIETRWSRSVGEGVGASAGRLVPAFNGERIYLADHAGNLYALDATDGTTVWQQETGQPFSAGPEFAAGSLLLGTREAEALAYDSADGALRWRSRVSSEVLAVPRVADGVVVVHSIDGWLAGLDLATGARQWVYDRGAPLLTLRGSASPVLYEGLVIGALDSGRLVALSLDQGRTDWEATIAQPQGRTELERMVDVDADPLLREGVVYAMAYQGRLAAVDADSGRIVWVRDLAGHAGLAADADHVYAVDDESRVWALHPGSGASLWRQDALRGRNLTAPALIGDYLVVGDFEGYLHWLARADGELIARVRLDDEPVLARPLAAQSALYALSASGRIAAYSTP